MRRAKKTGATGIKWVLGYVEETGTSSRKEKEEWDQCGKLENTRKVRKEITGAEFT